jgi:hypothetical protein
MYRLALALALVAAGTASHARQAATVTIPPDVRAAADRITADQLARDLAYLASDELKGRNTPSPGFDAAAKYVADRLQKAGLKPLGDNGTYFQHYELRETRVEADGAYLDVGGQRFPFGEGFVIRSFRSPLSGALPAVYVGHGWSVPAQGIDPYAGVDVKGKIVIAHGPRALPKGTHIQQIGRISVGGSPVVAEAARRGAAAVIYLPHGSALENWDAMRRQNLVRRELEPSVPSAYAAQPITSVLVSRAAADALMAGERAAGAGLFARAEGGDYPASFELSRPVTLHVPAAEPAVHRPYNVVAMIEGTDARLKSEYITIASHLDGAVGTREVDGDAIYNSADDNASGSAGTLSIAEQMIKAPPRRSIVFIWDSGEEQGLWGTRYFVDRPPVPLDAVVAHFNVDMIGANRAPGSPDAAEGRVTGPNEVFLIGPGVLSRSATALLASVNDAYLKLRLNQEHDRASSEFFYPRTDAGPFLERGILTIGVTTGIHNRYHLPADEARALDPKKMEAIARTVFVSAWMLAGAAERPAIDAGAIPPTVPDYRASTR